MSNVSTFIDDCPPVSWCSNCKEPCGQEMVDSGIGSYEWWGHNEFQESWDWLSDCCHAELLDHDPLPDKCHDCGARMPEGEAWPIDDELLACDECAIKRGLAEVGA